MRAKPYTPGRQLRNQIQNAEKNFSHHNYQEIKQMKLEMLASGEQKEQRVRTIISQLNQLAPHIDFKLDDPGREDLLQLARKINQDEIGDMDHSIWTLCEYKQAVKSYYSWKSGEKHPDILDFMRVHPKESEKPRIQKEELLDIRMVEKMINAAENPRDKVFMAMLWDSGARLSELLTLEWRHITFQDDIAQVHIWNGKNRPRKIFLVESVPMIKHWRSWKKRHGGVKSGDPILTNIIPKGSKKMLSARNAAKQINSVRDRISLPDRVRTNPHAWRKSRATNYAGQGMTQPNMNLQFGWAPGSDASKYYISLAKRDLERQIREIYPGLDELEEEGPEFIGENIPEYSSREVESFAGIVS